MLKKGDLILIGCLLAAVLIGYGGLKLLGNGDSGSQRIAVIKQGDKVIRKINLDEVQAPERMDVSSEYHQIILVEKGRIRFEEADCPDKVCVKTGWLSEKGKAAVCLPNKTIIKIEGEGEKVDGGTY